MTHSGRACPIKVSGCSLAESYNMTILNDRFRARECAYRRLLAALAHADDDKGHRNALQTAYNYYRHGDNASAYMKQRIMKELNGAKRDRALRLLSEMDQNPLVIDDYVSKGCMDRIVRSKPYACSVCGAPGVNVLSCPGNPNALNSRPHLHWYQPAKPKKETKIDLNEFPPLVAASASASESGSTVSQFLISVGWHYSNGAYYYPHIKFPCVYMKVDDTQSLPLKSATWYDQKRSYKLLMPFIQAIVIQSQTHDIYVYESGSGLVSIREIKQFITQNQDDDTAWVDINVLMDQLKQ